MFSVLMDQTKKGDKIQLFFLDGSTLSGRIDTISEKYILLKTETGKTTITKTEFENKIGRWTIIENIDTPIIDISQQRDQEPDISDSPNHVVDLFLGNFGQKLKARIYLFKAFLCPLYYKKFKRVYKSFCLKTAKFGN